jgi:hypothetical protein
MEESKEYEVPTKGEIINFAKLTPLHQANCEHDYQEDLSDTSITGAVAYICIHCHRGYMLRKPVDETA